MRRLFFYFLFVVVSLSVNAQNPAGKTESSEPLGDKYLDDIVKRSLIFEAKVMPYEALREADIPWSKKIWRIIETREKVNIPFRSPQRPFFSILIDGINSGAITAFKDEEFKEIMTVEEVKKQIFRMDSITYYDPDTYEETVKVVPSEINPDDIKRYRLKEIWYFDKEASMLKVRILGISALHENVDPTTGEVKYELPLFWIYYPEMRETLAKETVLSDFNDVFPMTWFDLMENRMFSSYIIKTTNVLDLRLADKYDKSLDPSMDILLESERLKEELFNFEQDLWSY
ncbi:MAG: gliding motility protein GldN [Deltaproteobacteria bacterium]